MQFSEELKKLIEEHPDIIDLIEEHDIKTLYVRLLGGAYPYYLNYDVSDECVGEMYDLLMGLDINPLKYLTTLPKKIIQGMSANQLVIPSNIVKINPLSISNSRIDTIVIEANKIDIDNLLWLKNTQINNLICNSIYIKFSYQFDDTLEKFLSNTVNTVFSVNKRSTHSVEFTFKKNAKVFYNNAYHSIRKIIEDGELNKTFDITLI